ncbi:MAG: hypothetical protein ACYS22_12310 [Planctomycetota bacterium]|jgi:uncharacterized membrane protein YkvA (DUF1232 family)
MHDHDWLHQELAGLHWYAHYLREALTDGDLPDGGRNPAAAASKYLLEWEDLVPDTDPQFGYIDDLFAIYLGLSELMKKGGRHGKSYGQKVLPAGHTLQQAVADARSRFKGFWAFIEKEVGPGFQHVARAVRKDKEFVRELVTMLGNYIDAYAQREVPVVDPDSLKKFMAKYDRGGR